MTALAIRSSLRTSRIFSLLLLIISAAAFYVAATLNLESAKTVILPFGGAGSQADSSAATSAAKSLTPFQEALQALRTQMDKADPFDPQGSAAWLSAVQSLESFSEPGADEIKKQITALTSLDKKLAAVRFAAPTVIKDMEGLIGRGGPLFKGFVAEGSPFEQVAATLELLKPDFVALATKKPAENIKALQVNLKALAENRAKLNDPGIAPQFNDRRRAIIEKLDASILMRSAKEWESTVFAYIARTDEIRRITDQALKPAEPPSTGAASGAAEVDRETLVRVMIALGVVSLIASIALVLRSDQNVLTAFDQTPSRSAGAADAQSVAENLPYLQIAAKQSAELGRQVAVSLKKLVKATTAAVDAKTAQSASEPSGRVSVITNDLEQSREMLKTILREHTALKEGAIQLSIAVNQAVVDPKIHDLVDHFSESIEHVESRMTELFEQLAALGQSASAGDEQSSQADQQDELLFSLSRESEGLLVAVSQWSRQFDRLTETLQGLEESLTSRASGSLASDSSRDAIFVPTEPGFKRGLD